MAEQVDPCDDVQSLVRRAQEGDLAAFKRIYAREAGRIHAFCLRMAANRYEAGIYTQDTFVRAWERLDTFRGHSAFSTWLHRIAVNVVLGDIRTTRRRRARVLETDDAALLESFGVAPAHDTALDLETCIGSLPERARAVLILHDIQGYKHEEIAGMMEISPGTSKAHLHRARTLLKSMLSDGA